jgi:hypothetical protein
VSNTVICLLCPLINHHTRAYFQTAGEAGLELCERVFWAWEVFAHTHDRRELQRTIRIL